MRSSVCIASRGGTGASGILSYSLPPHMGPTACCLTLSSLVGLGYRWLAWVGLLADGEVSVNAQYWCASVVCVLVQGEFTVRHCTETVE